MEAREESASRIIGIRHRIKRTADGEARPTMVAIFEPDGSHETYKLETETDELDWLKNRLPRTFRDITPDDDPSFYPDHQLKFRKVKKGESLDGVPERFIRRDGKFVEVITKVPETFDGLRAGDRVAMTLGGSGDYFAFAISARGTKIGAQLFRIPPAQLKENRPAGKEEDEANLASLLTAKPELFYETTKPERDLIQVRERYRARMDAMKARIATEQRLRRRVIGMAFCSEDGEFPEGTIEKAFDDAKANDAILNSQVREESRCERELENVLSSHWVWQEILAHVQGVGIKLAARIVASIPDILAFPTEAKFKAYCGVHVLHGGKWGDQPTELQFPRRRQGLVANWSGDVRQAAYLFQDQAQYRPDTKWGRVLRHYMQHFRTVHPIELMVPKVNPRTGKPIMKKGTDEPVMVKRYTDGHIFKMARWRTGTKFFEWLYDEWTKRAKARAGITTHEAGPRPNPPVPLQDDDDAGSTLVDQVNPVNETEESDEADEAVA